MHANTSFGDSLALKGASILAVSNPVFMKPGGVGAITATYLSSASSEILLPGPSDDRWASEAQPVGVASASDQASVLDRATTSEGVGSFGRVRMVRPLRL